MKIFASAAVLVLGLVSAGTAILPETELLGSVLTYEKVRLVDYDAAMNTWLFRSNLPSKDGVFLWEDLTSLMAQRAKEANLTFPNVTAGEELEVYDINLLYPWETDKISIEEDFFYGNPDLGTFVSWPIFGSKVDINTLNDTERRDLIANYTQVQNDYLPERIPYIHRLVHPDFPPETPTAYLFHCAEGSDRTGEVSGSYAMTYQNKTLMEAYAWDQEVS